MKNTNYEAMTPEEKQEFEKLVKGCCMSTTVDRFANPNDTGIYKPHIPTGFSYLDEVLGDGLVPGLHCIGAMSALGKTTFALQMGENIARGGTPSLVFSLEMLKEDLTAKAISRGLFVKYGPGSPVLKTADDLMKQRIMENLSEEEWKAIASVKQEIKLATDKMFVFDRRDKMRDVDTICDCVKGMVAFGGIKPVVIVDYLQFMPAMNPNMTERQKVDYNLDKLDDLAVNEQLTVVLISSVNRSSYKEEMSCQALKETGGIEYDSDTILGLQIKGAGTPNFNFNDALARCPREVEFLVLKNRYGAVAGKIQMLYYPQYNYFEEVKKNQKNTYPHFDA